LALPRHVRESEVSRFANGRKSAIVAEPGRAPGYHWSGQNEAGNFASGLDEAGLNKYYARLPRKRGC